MLAIIDGQPARFAPFSELFRQALDKFGQPARPIGVHSPGHVGATDEQAREEFWPAYREVIARLGPSRGFPPPTRELFEREVGPRGALYVGSPEAVANKIARNLPILGATKFDLKHGMPGMTQQSLLQSIELFGTMVVPRVREQLATPAAV
jgi:alkanesulfonate monooxygenase SsuD/methylene tetrahydromethanopterin reductase-like flavin-dependent oxidoreductase (luciferase family)